MLILIKRHSEGGRTSANELAERNPPLFSAGAAG
jgi:hypothetical protein